MIYVHHNPSHIVFNTFVYVFIRNWYAPQSLNMNDDAWYKLPALRTDLSGGRAHFSPCNSYMMTNSNATVTEDGTLIKMGRSQPNSKIDDTMLALIVESAVNISGWEENNQRSWPYEEMFNNTLMRQRYQARYGAASSVVDPEVTNRVYTQLYTTSGGKKPCNCGKKKR